ncbi:hypothetical protein H9L12_12490 [Sphingomonas rhizophila]|uniref:DUF4760 domain-containing protein n=1 Tax=Sphingomonas rhizophila TaxID=2071607 RepID=A0A7G9SEP0_9SPHN|nr:hypothetical protein H9L12_12490 [Sphingomonas rhizophila]
MGSLLASIPLLALVWDSNKSTVALVANGWVTAGLILLLLAGIVWRLTLGTSALRSMEIDEANFGLGEQKIKLKPNVTDKQIAYAIWVELSTRKIGLSIDLENDVVSEVYDSWYGFFTVTRELVKAVPVQKVARDSTQKIIKLSIEVLNQGLRPHLTKWQARFRHWYDRELKRYDEGKGDEVLDPQMIQQKFPQYDALVEDLMRVNAILISYRREMHRLVLKD